MLAKTKNFLLSCLFTFMFIASACAQSQPDTKIVQEQLGKMFPNFKVSEVNPTDIPELYEVIGESGQIVYYSPKGYLIFGEIWTVTGKSITGEKKQKIQKKKMQEALASVPYDKALKIGKGDKKIIEITDPTCPYCQMAAKELKKRNDITKYVFFFPIRGEESLNKMAYIICSKNQEQAYYEIYENPNKSISVSKECKDKANKIIQVHQSFIEKLAVRGTPFFIINETPVPGANMPLIDELLKN